MSISIRCPACGAALRVDDSLAGRKVRCSGCKEPFVATAEPPDEPEVDSRPAKRTSLRRPAVDQPLIPKLRTRDEDERPEPVPVWKREMKDAVIYSGCLVAFLLFAIAAFFVFTHKKATPPSMKSEYENISLEAAKAQRRNTKNEESVALPSFIFLVLPRTC